MTTRDTIIREIQKIPENMLKEILDFICFLESKRIQKKHSLAFASESSLIKDWLKPEEDEAWQDL